MSNVTTQTAAIQRDYRQSVLVWLHLVRVFQLVGRVEADTLAAYGLTQAQFDLLSHLAVEPGLSQQALASRLLVTKGNITGLLDRMEAAGLVERRSDPGDRRAHQIFLTRQGDQVFEAAAPALEEVIGQQMGALTDGEQADLLRLLGKLDRSLRR